MNNRLLQVLLLVLALLLLGGFSALITFGLLNGARSTNQVGNLQPVLPHQKTDPVTENTATRKRSVKKAKRTNPSVGASDIARVQGSSTSDKGGLSNTTIDRQAGRSRGRGTGKDDASKERDRANSGSKDEVENESGMDDDEDKEDVEDHDDD